MDYSEKEVMMLLDINAYVGHWPFKRLKYNTCASLLARMNKFRIDKSVISNLHGVFYKNTQSANEEVFEEINSDKQFNTRFIPFAVINPIYAGWKQDLENSVKNLGMKGIRIYPLYHDYELNDPRCIELVRRARDLNLVVALTLRIVDSRQRSWLDIDREWTLKDIIPIIREVPDARYMILNVANGIRLNDEDRKILKGTDFVFDTSGRELNAISELLGIYGPEKFAFGSHAPVLDHMTGLLRIESLREGEADESAKELMRSGNAKRILRL